MQCLPSKNFAYDAADSSLALPALALRSASRSSPELYTCLQVTAALQPVPSAEYAPGAEASAGHGTNLPLKLRGSLIALELSSLRWCMTVTMSRATRS